MKTKCRHKGCNEPRMKCPGNNNLYFPNCVTHQIDIVKKKAHIEVEKEKRKEIRLKKDQIINYKAKLQSKVNEIARLIDIGLPCLAKQIHSPQMHGGHVYSVGSNATARFNLHNIHRQGAQSNHFQNDDGLMKEGLRREYGQEYFDFVSGLRNTPQIGFNNLEYKEKYKIASNIANELRRNGERFNLNERIEKRNEINLKLGIYSFEKCLYTTPGE